MCYGSFIGPIKQNGQNEESLFFISFAEQSNLISDFIYLFSDKINLNDFTIKTSKSEIPDGHIFGLYNSKSKYWKGKSTESIENIKEIRNLGNQIKSVTLIKTEMVKNGSIPNGILINYHLGDICDTINSKYSIILLISIR